MARPIAASGETRLSALWGKGGRGGDGHAPGRLATALVAAFVLVLAAPSWASAGAFVPGPMLETAKRNPRDVFHVIVVAEPGTKPGALKNTLLKDERGNQFGLVRREFKHVLEGVAADITGKELAYLAKRKGIRSITPDGRVRASGYSGSLWTSSIGANELWEARPAGKTPAIAIVDTGVDKDRVADFGGRVVASVSFSSLKPDPSDSSADYSGHGTLVAGIAAGGSRAFPGVAPRASLVSLRVANGEGKSIKSDVIAAADWIYENRRSYNIRVANFSLGSPFANFGLVDPLNEAVRRLWLTGTVVVASAGNNGAGRMLYAPASEPFVITVGATDISETASVGDDRNAPWSSHGYTAEGFAKPELAAPGRYMPGPIARTSSLAGLFANRVVAPGYMWMSGTSFAAPVVSGAAAQLLARNPSLTPDMVKGALMATARPLPFADPGSVGVGQLDLPAAAGVRFPPNPNSALRQFVRSSPRLPGGYLDTDAWAAVAAADPDWIDVSWSDVSWSDVSWTDVSWSDVSWSDVSWSDVSWSDVSWSDASWTDVSWTDVSWADASWADSAPTD
ncbi:MAG TPA: S8 family serine peptidase [Gaiellaceae bacterium]|nr:S8 family serine peptidase [Gaiellaceae bacterium]HEX2495498.1 S8 family serine peptidase [Gaiellaceae bacterium]